MATSVSMTILMIIVTILAVQSEKYIYTTETSQGKIVFERRFTTLIVIVLSIYASLRTRGNDTTGYIKHFIDSKSTLPLRDYIMTGAWKNAKGPIFDLLRIVCKYYIADNYHIFFLIVALITNGLIIFFLRRYSANFALSVFLFLAMDGYGVTLTGMRQALATAIMLWTIPLAVEKKWLKYIILSFVAYKIHFVSIVLTSAIFMKKKLWGKSVLITVICAIIAGFSFDRFSATLLETTEYMGFSYTNSILDGTGVSIFRILVYAIPPVLLFLVRKYFDESDEVHNMIINSTTTGASFVALGRMGNANTFGRFGLAFEPCIYIALPEIVKRSISPNSRKVAVCGIMICFFIYYLFGLAKNGFWVDYYGMASITCLFGN